MGVFVIELGKFERREEDIGEDNERPDTLWYSGLVEDFMEWVMCRLTAKM